MNILKKAAISAFAGQIAAILFLLIGGLALKNSDDPLRYGGVVVTLAMLLSAGVCGALAAFLSGEERVPTGFAAGALCALLTILLSLLPGSAPKSFWQASIPLVLQIALPGLICFLFSKKTTGHGAHRRRAKRRYNGR